MNSGDPQRPVSVPIQPEKWLSAWQDESIHDKGEPPSLEPFIERLYTSVFSQPLVEKGDVPDAEIWMHSLRALLHRTASRLELTQQARQELLSDLMAGHDGPLLAVSDRGVVLAINEAGRARWSLHPGEELAQLRVTRSQFESFRARCSAGRPSMLLGYVDGVSVLMSGMAAPELSGWLLSSTQWQWPPGFADGLRAVFNLSARECEVLSALCQGQDSASIASLHSCALGTVRQQVKAVLGKLGVGSQAQAVALVAAASSTQRAWEARPDFEAVRPMESGVLNAPGGRQFGWRAWGDPRGTPLLLIHGSLFGAGGLISERATTQALGLRVMAAERPGYGHTAMVDEKTYIATAVNDVLCLLDAQGVASVTVLAHDIGTALAFHLAARAPDRVRAIVAGPSTPPMRDWQQTNVMPPAHRIYAWAAQRMPWLLDSVISMGLAQVRRQGVTAMPGLIFGGCDVDRDAWLREDRLRSAGDAFALISAQNAQGFKFDMRLTNQDWSAVAAQTRVPVHLLHGQLSQTVDPQALSAFSSIVPRAELEFVPDAGHTLALTHFGLLLTRAVALVAADDSAN